MNRERFTLMSSGSKYSGSFLNLLGACPFSHRDAGTKKLLRLGTALGRSNTHPLDKPDPFETPGSGIENFLRRFFQKAAACLRFLATNPGR
jgi:hypothetical protein